MVKSVRFPNRLPLAAMIGVAARPIALSPLAFSVKVAFCHSFPAKVSFAWNRIGVVAIVVPAVEMLASKFCIASGAVNKYVKLPMLPVGTVLLIITVFAPRV